MAVGTAASGVRQYTSWFGAAGADGHAHARHVGGKGASLARLIGLGFRVPPAFGLTTAAFEAHVTGIADQGVLRDALAGLPAEDARATVARLVEASPMPTDVTAALTDGLGRLMAAIPPELRGSGFAVRSSGVEEDGVVASFAGLHETQLGVTNAGIPDAVRRCWASLWSAPAVAYRTRRGLPVDRVSMAVVVQALVPADAAAVVFTRHPVTGRDDQLLINAVRGLGEPMVSGTVTPDALVVDRASRSVVELVPGDRAQGLVAGDAGLTDAPAVDGPVLSDAALRELVELALHVERAFGAPVDIEGAYAAGRWYLVQARPITTR